MTYCLAIKVDSGLVFASDSRTNAGMDHISSYSKMQTFEWPGERVFVLLSAGNLATTQAVMNRLRRDLDNPTEGVSLKSVEYLFDAAEYVGSISRHAQALGGAVQGEVDLSASFILGGQIAGSPPRIYLIYPEGNYIWASESRPYLQIGETKYGKPILDRVIQPNLSLEDAARCALVSIDSTWRSNVSVGPPFEVACYRTDALRVERHLSLDRDDPYYQQIQQSWEQSLQRSFASLPRFDWE